jgi:formylglycine-generating enzyme required for sulfatase activity
MLAVLLASGCVASARPSAPRADDDAEVIEVPDSAVPHDARGTPARDTPAADPLDLAPAADAVAPDEPGPVATDATALPPAADAAGAPVPAGTFANSLGMRFVTVPGLNVRFSIWETRVRDFEAYAAATGASVPHPEFPETALQPKASVSRKEAEAFAAWLTKTEQASKLIGAGQSYRLPSDVEWDAAIRVGKTGGPFPWGSGFPPPDHFANYGVSKDGFDFTAPVGSFAPNELGLFDLAGNLWEWIGQGCKSGGGYLVRGAGWNAHNQSYFNLDFHYCFGGDLVGHHNVGFRLVLEGAGP